MGASHITLGCDDVEAAIERLAGYGYRTDFVDRGVINNPSKHSFLSAPSELHGIALLRSDHGFPIELICYEQPMPDRFGRYVGVFECALAGAEAIDPDAGVASLPEPLASRWRPGTIAGLDAPAFFVKDATTSSGLTQVVLPVGDIIQAQRLWCGALGFKLQREGAGWAELQFVSPVAAWRLRMLLVAAPPADMQSVLDAKGMACLSFLSSNLSQDLTRLVASGATVATDVFSITINGKKMMVAILATPEGAFVELLQIVR